VRVSYQKEYLDSLKQYLNKKITNWFINICETFEALGRFKENTIDLSSFDQEAFQRLRQVSHIMPIPLNHC
jgi:hypothetical protein